MCAFYADEFKQKTNWSYLKEWLKGSTAIVYNSIGGQLVRVCLYLAFHHMVEQPLEPTTKQL